MKEKGEVTACSGLPGIEESIVIATKAIMTNTRSTIRLDFAVFFFAKDPAAFLMIRHDVVVRLS